MYDVNFFYTLTVTYELEGCTFSVLLSETLFLYHKLWFSVIFHNEKFTHHQDDWFYSSCIAICL